MDDLVIVTRRGTTATLTLNRPEKRNALSLALRIQLLAALNASIEDSICRAVIITGAGQAFCAGADLAEMNGSMTPSMEDRRKRLHLLQRISHTIIHSPKPVIAAVNGAAFGAGLSFVAACDGIVATEKAEFCAVFSRIGLLPDAGIMWTLPRRVGATNARRMLTTGERVGSSAALSMGLADEIVSEEALLETAHVMADGYRHSAPLAMTLIKQTLAREPVTLEAIFAYEAEVQMVLGDSEDSMEAKAAFFERRLPNFRSK